MTTLRDIGEDALIARLVALVPVHDDPAAGPGDDCAVIDPGGGSPELLLLKTDAMAGGVHFLMEAPARAVGWKAVARVVSDFAAMGGRPQDFLITVALPGRTAVAWVEDLYRGIGDCLRAFDARLAGGETSSLPDGSAPVISVAATGRVARDRVVLRTGGRPGDIVLVTGRLGGSLRGKHLEFMPRVEEAAWLVSGPFKPTAMMDLSDGLAKDLPRLAAASGCGYRLDQAVLPLTPGCSAADALNDGEDFELLITVAPDQVASLRAGWDIACPTLPLTAIGRLVEADGGDHLSGGWDHFTREPNRA